MTGELLAQRRDLFGRDGTAGVTPFRTNVCQNIGDLLIVERLVPWWHHGASKLFAFHFEWALQTFEHNHGVATRAAIDIFGTGERWIPLRFGAKSGGLMTDGAVRHENFF